MPAPSRLSATLVLGLTAAALAAGCGSDDEAAGNELDVVATTGIAAEIVSHVAGDDAEVTQLIADSAGPHGFQTSARDRLRIEDADLLVEFGTGLETTVPSEAAAELFTISEHAGELREGEHEEDGEEHAADEEHAGESLDPHVWMDPTRIARTLEPLARTLGRADPDDASAYLARAREYAERLRVLDRQIAEQTGELSPERRKLVTSHEALGYFASRYGFEIIATPFGLSPEAEASASDIKNVVEAVEAESVPAVFVEQGDDPQVLERVADETGVEVVAELLIEGFGPGADSYEEMIRFTATRITEAVGG